MFGLCICDLFPESIRFFACLTNLLDSRLSGLQFLGLKQNPYFQNSCLLKLGVKQALVGWAMLAVEADVRMHLGKFFQRFLISAKLPVGSGLSKAATLLQDFDFFLLIRRVWDQVVEDQQCLRVEIACFLKLFLVILRLACR